MKDYLNLLVERYPVLVGCRGDIQRAFELLRDCFASGGKLLVAGNGGSAADAEHIVGELMKGFVKARSNVAVPGLQGALPAIALSAHSALATAIANDNGADCVFAQQVYGYGRAGDVLLGISTSGNSPNVLRAVETATAVGMRSVLLTGRDGGRIVGLVDVAICVPEVETYRVQELHLPVYHTLCLMLEEWFF